MDTVLAQDARNEPDLSHSRRSLGRYPRILFMLLIALAFFGAVSVASSREAEAQSFNYVQGQYANGKTYWCHQQVYSWGWKWYGCYFQYDNLWHYETFGTGQIIVYSQGTWYDRTVYFRGSGFAPAVQYYGNNDAVHSMLGQLAGVTGQPDYAISARSASSVSPESSAVKTTPPITLSTEDSTAFEAPPNGSAPEEGQATKDAPITEATSAEGATQNATSPRATFPWKVAQDNTNSFHYTGWKQVRSKKALGGTYRVNSSRTKGAFFEAAGTTDAGGSTMQLITATGPKMGKAKVVVFSLGTAEVVKQVTFNLKTTKAKYKVKKKITGLTPHKPYGLAVFSANGRPVVVDAIGYEAHGNMCHPVYVPEG